jgi:hypothetical protein
MTSCLVLKSRYPNYIPAIVEVNPKFEISKLKYLMPKDVNFGVVMGQIRNNIKNIKPSEAITFLVDDQILSANVMVRELERDNFVFIKIIKESTFG